jgi:probable HAF family extracellular repeat protein
MRKTLFYPILLVVGMFLAGALPASAATPGYTCLNLTNLPGMAMSSTHPRAISEAGEVVGYGAPKSTGLPLLSPRVAPSAPGFGSPDIGGVTNTAFWAWFFGVPVDISTGPGFKPRQLNALSNVSLPDSNDPYWLYGSSRRTHWWVGNWQEYTSPYYFHAFLYNGANGGGSGTVWNLGNLGGSGSYSQSYANGVNDAGQVVGYSYTSSGTQHAFLYTSSMQDLFGGGDSTSSVANGINNAGQVVGVYGGSAFLWSSSSGKTDLGQKLNPPYNASSYATAINTGGQVAGYSSASSGYQHAFLYSNGLMKDLGSLGGYLCQALALNDLGQVVGYSQTTTGDVHAFLYSGGVMYDLNSLVKNLPAGVVLTQAFGINNWGYIIADGGSGGYSGNGYVLTPIAPLGQLDLLLLE